MESSVELYFFNPDRDSLEKLIRWFIGHTSHKTITFKVYIVRFDFSLESKHFKNAVSSNTDSDMYGC